MQILKLTAILFTVVVFCSAARGDHRPENRVMYDIVVTAQKQEQPGRDVPISMTLFDEFILEEREIQTIREIGDYTPSLLLFDIGFSTSSPPSIRGLFADALTLESTMGIYVDGIPVTMGVGINEPLMNIERVEVLKGPQGTLYGKNTEAGVLNIISKQPGNTPDYKVSGVLGSDSLRQVDFSLSGPVVRDKFYVGFSARHYEKDGYVENSLTGDEVDFRENDYGKLTLRYTPVPELDVTLLKSILKHDDGAGSLGSSFMPNRQVSSDLQGRDTSENDMTALKIRYDLGHNMALDTVTSHRVFDDKKIQDADFSPFELVHIFTDNQYVKTSQEVRVSGFQGELKWLLGVYGETFENEMDETWLGPLPTQIRQTIDGHSLGLFAHADYSLTTRLTLTAGLRYDDEKKSFRDHLINLDLENTYSELSPKFSAQYRFRPEIMGYATVAKGYRAGGFNPYVMGDYPRHYDQESLVSYELGVKSLLLGKRLAVDLCLYYMDISDMQVTANISGGRGGFGETYTSNAAEAVSKGAEIELKARLTKNLSAFGGLGLNETTYDSFRDPLGDYSGNFSKFAPGYNFNCGLVWRDDRGVYAGIDVTGYGKMYQDKTNQAPIDAYERVNLKLGYEAESFDVYLFGENIFDTRYDALEFAGLYDTFSPPAEWGIRVNLRF